MNARKRSLAAHKANWTRSLSKKVAAPSSEIVRALQVGHDALTDCVKHLLQRGPVPCPSFMATASGAVARALLNAKEARTPAVIKIESAFAACRSIRFAVTNASRHGGEFSLNDLLAADRLAREALDDITHTPTGKPRRAKKVGAS